MCGLNASFSQQSFCCPLPFTENFLASVFSRVYRANQSSISFFMDCMMEEYSSSQTKEKQKDL